jgi:hypothetical protein
MKVHYYTGMSYSLRASFSEVFLSVDSFCVPVISAQSPFPYELPPQLYILNRFIITGLQ